MGHERDERKAAVHAVTGVPAIEDEMPSGSDKRRHLCDVFFMQKSGKIMNKILLICIINEKKIILW